MGRDKQSKTEPNSLFEAVHVLQMPINKYLGLI